MADGLNHEEGTDDVNKDLDRNVFLSGLETLEVENIIDTRVTKGNTQQYLVCFKSWLTEDYLQDYSHLIQSFWKNKIKLQNDDRTTKEPINNFTSDNENAESISTNGYSPPYKPSEELEEHYTNGVKVTEDNGFIEDESNGSSLLEEKDGEEQQKEEEELRKEDESIEQDISETDISDDSLKIDIIENNDKNQLKETSNSVSNENSDVPCKKRKLKSLNDIVRKITKVSDVSESKDTDDEQKLTDRLHTLDQTLRENENEERHENGENNNDDKPTCNESNLEEASSLQMNGHVENNVYWSAGKAYHKSRGISEHNHDLVNQNNRLKDSSEEQSEKNHSQTEQPQVKSRQRYHKCRFCSTLYSDPILLERHESSHFAYRGRHVIPLHEGIPPPPLVPVSEDRREFPQYKYEEGNGHSVGRNTHSPLRSPSNQTIENHHRFHHIQNHEHKPHNDNNEFLDNSIVRKPIRNLLTKMYESEVRDSKKTGYPEEERYSRVPVKNEKKDQMHEEAQYPGDSLCPSPEYHKGIPNHSPRDHSPRDHIAREHVSRDHSARDNSPRSHSPGDHRNGEDAKDALALICSLCKKSFSKREALEQHYDSDHPDSQKFSCEVCNEIFVNKELYNSHCMSHVNQNYVCGYCRKVFDRRSAYETHLRSHTQERPFRCHICGRSFSLRTNLRRHLLIHTDLTPYYCHVCGKGFRRSDMLSCHMKQYHTHNGTGNGNTDPSADSKHNFDGHQEPHLQHQHPLCDDRNQQSEIPMRVRKSPRPTEQSPSRSSSTSHDSAEQQRYEPIKLIPTNAAPGGYYKEQNIYPYDPSTRRSPSNRNPATSPNSHNNAAMHHHMTEALYHRHHGRPPPNEVYDPNYHMVKVVPVIEPRPYSPIKPNPVKILPRPPPQQAPQQTGPFECLKCGEQFSSPSLYDIHVQSHKEVFECEKCHKSFSSRSQYDSHMQSHDTNKSHKCPYCHRSFSMKGNLRRHIRIHTNEAPYECPICYQRFRRSDGLKGHIKRHETLGESAPTDLLPSQAS